MTKDNEVYMLQDSNNDLKMKKLELPEGLNLSQVKIEAIENFYNDFMFIDTAGVRYKKIDSLLPSNIENKNLQILCHSRMSHFLRLTRQRLM